MAPESLAVNIRGGWRFWSGRIKRLSGYPGEGLISSAEGLLFSIAAAGDILGWEARNYS
jgi:hypothetical protein